MAETDTSAEAVGKLAESLPFTQWMAPRLYTAAETLRALIAERDAALAEVARLLTAICDIAISANDDDGFTSDGHERCVDRATNAYRAALSPQEAPDDAS